jgi:hypothetical protein
MNQVVSWYLSRDVSYLSSFVEFKFKKKSKKIRIFCSVNLVTVGARETWLPVGNQISQPVTKSLVTTKQVIDRIINECFDSSPK